VDKRFRNGIQNSKSMPGADCKSDHNPVVVTVTIRPQKNRKAKSTVTWNINKLKNSAIKDAYKQKLGEQLKDRKADEEIDIDGIWNKLKESLEIVAEEICGKAIAEETELDECRHTT
jgi:hypothetical protein